MTRESLIEWATSWVPTTSPTGEPGQQERFAAALTQELKDWREPGPDPVPELKPVACKNCPFYEHVHYVEAGKLVAPGCPGFEALEA